MIRYSALAGLVLSLSLAVPGLAQAGQSAHAAKAAPAVQATGISQADFAELLKESGLVMNIPEDFTEIPVPQTDVFSFEKAWRKKDGSMEIRVAIRPISRMIIDYEDPHGSAPDPNDVYSMVFAALLGQLSTQGELPSRDLPQALARKTFNAEWASIALMGADPAINTKHKEAMLLGIHKNRMADAYVLYLYDNPEKAKPQLNRLLKIIKFSHATPLEVLKAKAEADRKAREGFLKEGGDQPQCVPPEGAREVHKTAKDLDQSPQ